tara:strand:+ start:442 stop:837 length:396 start_codon:yes stop_codon:yes gene_type:complete
MKYIIFILAHSVLFGQNISHKKLLQRASINSESCDSLIRYFNNQNTSIEKGYLGAGLMIKAKHEKKLHAKWQYFKRGKAKLEDAIKTEPNSIELRKIRNHIQNNIPRFLNYNNRKEDEFFIKKNNNTEKKR